MGVPLLLRVCLVFLLGNMALAQISAFGNATTTAATKEGQDPHTRENSKGKVQVAHTETGFESVVTSAPVPKTSMTEGEDVGSVIRTMVSDNPASVTVEPEDLSSTHNLLSVHGEATEEGFESLLAQTPAPTAPRKPNIWTPTLVTNNGQTFTPLPTMKVNIGGQTLTPGGEMATIGEGDGATKVRLDPSGAPVVVVGDSTSTAPVPTAPSQVFNIGELTATAEATGFQFLVASSTLAVGQSVTVAGTIIALTTNAAGATLLITGDSTTTLAAPVQAIAVSQGLDIATTVVDGTTQYVIGSQTLAPGHPVTIDGNPISIATVGSKTVLIVGDSTTTLSSAKGTDFTITSDIAVATPGYSAGSGGGAAATPTSKKDDAGQLERWTIAAYYVFAFVIVVLGLG